MLVKNNDYGVVIIGKCLKEIMIWTIRFLIKKWQEPLCNIILHNPMIAHDIRNNNPKKISLVYDYDTYSKTCQLISNDGFRDIL